LKTNLGFGVSKKVKVVAAGLGRIQVTLLKTRGLDSLMGRAQNRSLYWKLALERQNGWLVGRAGPPGENCGLYIRAGDYQKVVGGPILWRQKRHRANGGLA